MRRRCCCGLGICQADFTFSGGGPGDNSWNFTDLSVGADSWLWDFGDGGTSTVRNPSHTFPDGRCYTVTLNITRGPLQCSAAKRLCGIVECTFCNPDDVPSQVIVTIPSTIYQQPSGPFLAPNACKAVSDSVPGSYVVDHNVGCTWGFTFFNRSSCDNCNPGVGGLQRLGARVRIGPNEFGSPVGMYVYAQLSLGPSSVGTGDSCTNNNRNYMVKFSDSTTIANNCRGVHTLNIRPLPNPGTSAYCLFPPTIEVII